MRKKQLIFNTISSLSNQVVVLICGFILPKLILKEYGSDINGLVSSITQYLGFVTLLDAGVGAVVQSAYYKPLAEKDNRTVSLLYSYSKKYYKTLAFILVCYVILLCVFFPSIVSNDFDVSFIVSLIVILSISSFAQFFIGAPQQLLLNANQRLYIQTNAQTIVILVNTLIGAGLIIAGFSIHIVKLASSIIFLVRPLFLNFYIKNYYSIDYRISDKTFKILQKWNGFAQHCATVIMNNTDIMVLTVLASLSDVSIYSIYNLVVYGMRQLISSVSNGFNSLLGNILACGEKLLLIRTFSIFEWAMHTLVTAIFSMTGILILPFVENYTANITDAQYSQPLFAVLITLAQAVYCIRIPYNTMVSAAGHYKQTQLSAVIEILINVSLSIVFVSRWGLIGVALGTLIAMAYRTLYFIWYLHNNILFLKYKVELKQLIADAMQFILVITLNELFLKRIPSGISYLYWLLHANLLAGLTCITFILFNGIVFKRNIIELKKMFLKE